MDAHDDHRRHERSRAFMAVHEMFFGTTLCVSLGVTAVLECMYHMRVGTLPEPVYA